MSYPSVAQCAFTAGEWSPRLYGRTDLQKYGTACSVLENMTVMPHGAARRRMGTRFVWDIGTEEVLLIPFVFNTEQAYVLEWTPGRLRFYRDGGLLLGADGAPCALQTPYTWEDLCQMKHTQSADVMYLVTARVRPQVLTRPGVDSFVIKPVEFTGMPATWTEGNWPCAITFHQQRLWLAGTPTKPQTLWASRIGNFENFTIGTTDDDAISVSLVSEQANSIRWLMSAKALLVGSSGGEWAVSGLDMDDAITAKNIRATRNSNYGTSSVTPLLVGRAVVDTSSTRKKVRELVYQFAEDGYVATELSLLAEHLTRPGVRQMAHAQEPDAIIWCVLDNGGLVGCTCLREQEVVAWHRHSTQGRVISVAVIPAAGHSETWLAVARAGGVYMEVMPPAWEGGEDGGTSDASCWYVDCGAYVDAGAGATLRTVSGLAHLEGCTVALLADGGTHPPQQVQHGCVELASPARTVLVGLPYIWQLAPMFPEGSSARGTAQGKSKRVVQVLVRLYESMGVRYRLWNEPGVWITPARDVTDPMDAPPAPYTGDVRLRLAEGWNRDGRYVLSGAEPLPATVIMTAPEVVSYE